MKIRLTLLLAAVLLVVAACAPSQELRNEQYLIDDSLTLSGTDCDAPCWRGITPGETAWSSAITILEDQEDITNVQVESNEESGELALTFQRRDGIPCCLLYSNDGQVVNQMLLQLAPTNTLGQVIEALGEPTYFNGTEVDEAQAAAALFYPELGIVVYAFVGGATGDLTAASEVFASLYLSMEDMAEVLSTSTLQAFDGYKPFSEYLSDAPAITSVPLDTAAEELTPESSEAEEASPEADVTVEPTPTSEEESEGFGRAVMISYRQDSTAVPTLEPTPTVEVTPTEEQSLRNEQYLIDDSLVTVDEECNISCWRGITLGVTEFDEAIGILEDQDDLSNIEIETNEESDEIVVTFQRVDGIPCCLLYSADGVYVDQILLQFAPDNTLGEVIEVLGEPDYFNGTEVNEDEAAAALFYVDLGLVVYAFVEGAEGDLTADSEIFAALYLAEDMAEVLETSTLQAFDGYKPFSEYLSDEPVVTPVLSPSLVIPTTQPTLTETAEPADTNAEATPGEDITATPTP